jgi:uncharacterized cupin superfamily protein
MSGPNVFDPSGWEGDLGSGRGSPLGPAAGCQQFGCALYEFGPGGQAAPYHAPTATRSC